MQPKGLSLALGRTRVVFIVRVFATSPLNPDSILHEKPAHGKQVCLSAALHNHFFSDEPKVYFMHIGGEGSVEALASGVRAAFDAVKADRAKSGPQNTFGGPPLGAQSSINAVSATWPMREYKANFPMALDDENRRLFIGCRSPARLVVLDTESGKAVSSLAISGDTDDLFYYPPLKRIYISCGEGFIDVVDQRNPGSYERRQKIATAHGARTSYLSADLRQFFLAVPKQDKKEAEIRVFKVEPRSAA